MRLRRQHNTIALILAAVVATLGAACAPAAPVPTATVAASPMPAATPTLQPPEGAYARILTSDGRTVYVRLEVADTAQERSVGLSKRSSLPADSGMVFLYQADHQGAFWMKDTWIPLSIAFIASDGRIVEIQDMEANTENVHIPKQSYRNALEVNRGFFENNGVKAGDRVELQLGGR